MYTDACPAYAPFFGVMGCVFAIALTSMGAAYGTAKAGVGIYSMGIMRPDMIVRCMALLCHFSLYSRFRTSLIYYVTHATPGLIPVVMAGILAIYGLVVSVLVSSNIEKEQYSLFNSMIHMGAGLAVGLAGLAAGFSIGVTGDAGVRGTAQQPRLFVAMVLIQIFSEVLGLYGLIVALLINSRFDQSKGC